MTNITDKTLGVIEKTRQKPEHIRHIVSLTIAGTVTLALFLVWAFVLLPFRFSESGEVVKKDDISPFTALKAQVGGLYDSFLSDFKNQVGDTQDKSLWQSSYEKIKSEAQATGE